MPLAWIAAAVAATISLPGLADTRAAPIDDLAAKGGEAASTQALSTRAFGFPLATDTVVVQRDPGGLSSGVQRRTIQAAQHTQPPIRAAIPVPNGTRPTTAVTYLLFAPDANVDERTTAAERYGRESLGGKAGAVVGVTGPSPAREAQFQKIENGLPIIEAASVALIALITAIAFRSIGAPLVTLAAAAVAYAVAMRILPWLADRANVTVPKEIEPVVVVLLLGLITDYSIFFLSAARRRLRAGDERLPAARGAVAEVAPIVLTAGLIVAAGTAALVVGHLEFFRAFGPGLAATTLITLVVAMTLVPALVALFGRRLFGASTLEDHEVESEGNGAPRWADEKVPLRLSRPLTAMRRTEQLAQEHGTSRWRLRASRIAASRPVALPIALVAVAALAFAALNVRSTELGLSLVRSLPASSEPRRAADAAAQGFAPGIVAPTEVVLRAPGIGGRRAQLTRLQDLVAREHGVARVVGAGELPRGAPAGVAVSRDGNAARFAVVFDSDPLEAPAIDDLGALRDRMPTLMRSAGLGGTRVAYGGQTQLADDTVSSVLDDLARVAVVVVLVNLVLLIVFMRALVAPLYLVAASVLGLLASLGVTTVVFQDALGEPDLTYYVPFAAAVLLVALGSDYNVFVAGRIWDRARRMRLREAIAVATPEAARAVTVAGIALAASFALLAIVPLRSFREFAFVMAAGVLIDTFVVRTLLVPALTSLFGERAWWPGRRVRRLSGDEFLGLVGGRTGLTVEEARAASDATLATLANRITSSEANALAAQLPRELRRPLRSARSGPDRFGADEFVRRVGEREGVDDVRAGEHARAVLATLDEAVAGDLDYVRAQLSPDYAALFDGPLAEPVMSTSSRRGP